MPLQDPALRTKTMNEVALGYSEEQAQQEAQRCLGCATAPCCAGCPVQVPIPRFIAEIQAGNFQSAIRCIKETNLLPAICGRVCPQERQCQSTCTVGKLLKNVEKAVAIGRLERFVADWEREQGAVTLPSVQEATGKKVAIIGSGPSGITCAAECLRFGHEVTVFEALHKTGGVLVYGIPEFRLPKAIVEAEISNLKKMGATIETNVLVGRTVSLAALQERFDAIFIGTGAGLPKFLGIAGEELSGVFSANEYLTRANLMKAYETDRADTPLFQSKQVAVIGGGNVAMDAARMAKRLGAEQVHVVYRRTRDEMPARAEEVEHAAEEGIIFDFLRNPTAIHGTAQGQVRSIDLQCFKLGATDSSGRRAPLPDPDQADYSFDCDTVIVALGNEPNPLLTRLNAAVHTDSRGRILITEDYQTSVDTVYAGGDIVQGAATVIRAMGDGRQAARAINTALKRAL
ncbi:MAG: NADPH-dependent glutamate synthase [Spirochaetaceae bacterium]|jgi:glutamate synthase (NADPH/NADH) small chain|nr:NADPH-dependent glutamate synthase [Spirochaetaceae bacterium]